MTEQQKVAELFDEAIALMNNSGAHWTQGMYSTVLPDGSKAYCAVGAIYAVTGQMDDLIAENDYYYAMIDQLRAELGGYAIVTWNDQPERTWEDVKGLFTRAKQRVLEGETA